MTRTSVSAVEPSTRSGMTTSSIRPPASAQVMPASKPRTIATAMPTAKTRSGVTPPTARWVSTLDSRIAAKMAPTAEARTLISQSIPGFHGRRPRGRASSAPTSLLAAEYIVGAQPARRAYSEE